MNIVSLHVVHIVHFAALLVVTMGGSVGKLLYDIETATSIE